jgi:hypothetical protein
MITETASLLLLIKSLLVDYLIVLNLFLNELSFLALPLAFVRFLTHATFVFQHGLHSQGQGLLGIFFVHFFCMKKSRLYFCDVLLLFLS